MRGIDMKKILAYILMVLGLAAVGGVECAKKKRDSKESFELEEIQIIVDEVSREETQDEEESTKESGINDLKHKLLLEHFHIFKLLGDVDDHKVFVEEIGFDEEDLAFLGIVGCLLSPYSHESYNNANNDAYPLIRNNMARKYNGSFEGIAPERLMLVFMRFLNRPKFALHQRVLNDIGDMINDSIFEDEGQRVDVRGRNIPEMFFQRNRVFSEDNPLKIVDFMAQQIYTLIGNLIEEGVLPYKDWWRIQYAIGYFINIKDLEDEEKRLGENQKLGYPKVLDDAVEEHLGLLFEGVRIGIRLQDARRNFLGNLDQLRLAEEMVREQRERYVQVHQEDDLEEDDMPVMGRINPFVRFMSLLLRELCFFV